MTLTTAGKNWLATNAGVNGCFSPTGVTFQDADGVSWTMGTKDVVTSFVGAHMAAKNDVIIVAGTTYNGFVAINGGDVGYPDVTFVYNSDGHTLPTPATLPLHCAPTANIVSTALTLSASSCTALCDVTGTVSWTNSGSAPSIPTDLNVTVTGRTPITVAPAAVINAGATTQAYQFSISGLVPGTYTVCASPGTHCQTLTVLVSAIFTSIPNGAAIYIDDGITTNTSSGVTPLTVTGLTVGDHTYKLTHADCTDVTGPFTTTTGINTVDVRFASSIHFAGPAGARIWIERDGVMTDTEIDAPGVVSTTTGTHAYKLVIPDKPDKIGNVTIPDCKRVNVSAGEGGMGPLMMGGLLMGMVLLGKKKDEKKEGMYASRKMTSASDAQHKERGM